MPSDIKPSNSAKKRKLTGNNVINPTKLAVVKADKKQKTEKVCASPKKSQCKCDNDRPKTS